MTTTISINDSDRQVLLELYEHLRGYYDTKHQKCPCCGASTGAKSFTTPCPKTQLDACSTSNCVIRG